MRKTESYLLPVIEPARALVLASSAMDMVVERSLKLAVADAVSLLKLNRLFEATSAWTSSLFQQYFC